MHLLTKPQSNVISDNMMLNLILTLTKTRFDNQFIYLYIKTKKFFIKCKALEGLYFAT